MSKKNGSNVSKQDKLDQIICEILMRSFTGSHMCYLGQSLVRAEKIVGKDELKKMIDNYAFEFNYREATKFMNRYKKAMLSLA